jgi:hypothetical protein
MALQDLGRNWWQKLFRRRMVAKPSGVPNRRCAECGHEVSGVGPDPTFCPSCGNRWRSA